MIKLKFKLDITNWLEVTWVEVEQHEINIPAKKAILDEDGNIIIPEESAYISLSDPVETELKHTSYHPTQIDLLKADANEMGTPLDDYSTMINEWVNSYTAPPDGPPIVPQEVSSAQAMCALLAAGLLDDVESMMAHPDTPRIHKIAWNKAQTFRRDSPTMLALAAQFGMTETELDSLFIYAGNVNL